MSGNDDHAWWADRRTLSGPPASPQAAGTPPTEPDESAPFAFAAWDTDTAPADPGSDPHGSGEPGPAPSTDWSAEALFADAGFDPTGPTVAPPVDDGTTIVVVATGLDEARLVLGVTAQADWDQITKAHRSLAMQFHPDRLGDLSPDAQELGRHRMAEINRAYETLREHHPA